MNGSDRHSSHGRQRSEFLAVSHDDYKALLPLSYAKLRRLPTAIGII
jgi:hypothetical protein